MDRSVHTRLRDLDLGLMGDITTTKLGDDQLSISLVACISVAIWQTSLYMIDKEALIA